MSIKTPIMYKMISSATESINFHAMKATLISMTLTFLCLDTLFSQTMQLPYQQIPDYPDQYSAGTVAARMIDGVGFRYYWATEGLREEDLAFRPTKEARSSIETLQHIYGLSINVVNAATQTLNTRQNLQLPYEELRQATLTNLKKASDILRNSSDADMVKFNMASASSSLPFWNMINGPIADCLWHIGQVVTFRRSSGNPYNSKANVLLGKLMD